MKTLSRPALLSLLLTIVVTGAYAAKPRAGKHVAKPITVNIQAVVDSALIMADDYATAMAQKPEFAPTRLNILRNYYTALPTDAARDSVRSRIFDFYVNYVEEGKAEQAEAFKSSFMSIAPDTDEHLGPLYANELTLARERFDTTAVKTNIDLLEAYANRMNYDYDDDLASARQWLHTIRTRPHINDILPGVWVSEDICTIKEEYNGVKDEISLIGNLAILRIRDINKILVSKQEYIPGIDSLNNVLLQKGTTSGYNLEAVKISYDLRKCFCVFSTEGGYVPTPISEAPGSNFEAPFIDKPMYISDARRTSMSKDYYSRSMQTDNDAYAAYIYWGDERLKVPNTEIGAIIRQTTQTTQALVAGQLSRRQYSFGEQLAGNLAAGLVSAGINSLVDAMMVSTDRIWGINLVVQMVNPYKLHAQVFAQLIETKSNSTDIKESRLLHEFDYYRWEPQDSVFFMGAIGAYDNDVLVLHGISKQQEKEYKKQAKLDRERFVAEKSIYYKQRKKEIEAIPNGNERNSAEEELKDYKSGGIWRIIWKKDWNKRALAKLKTKSDKYDQENL